MNSKADAIRAAIWFASFLPEITMIGLSDGKSRYCKRGPKWWVQHRIVEFTLNSIIVGKFQRRNRRAGPPVITGTLMDICLDLEFDERRNRNGTRRTDELCSKNALADDMNDATLRLAALKAGDPTAAEHFLTMVYDELRRLAASELAGEAPGQTLQPTALVHEAWLNLVGNRNPSFEDRTHFFRASAEAMRHILIDRARRKKAVRHGCGYRRIDFEDFDMASPSADDQVLAVNEALDKLAIEHPVQAEVVKLRYFGGLTNAEVSDVLGVSVTTVKNYWAFSRAWLLGEIERDEA